MHAIIKDDMKSKKLIIKRILLCALFSALLFSALFVVSEITKRKESRIKYNDFYKVCDQIDVLFLGSSHVINSINPLTLYSEYGITSYNMGGHGSPVNASYWELINALDYCNPSVVVIDSYMLEKDYKYIDLLDDDNTDEERQTAIKQLHLNMDAFKFSKIKLLSVRDLISDVDTWLEFLFPIVSYHDRWRELKKDDFTFGDEKIKNEKLFGSEMRLDVYGRYENYDQIDESTGLSQTTIGTDYMALIIEELQNRGIECIVTTMPFDITEDQQRSANSAGHVAAGYDVTYVDFNRVTKYSDSEMKASDNEKLYYYEIPGDIINTQPSGNLINYVTDLEDYGHVNLTGAEKVTSYMGEILSEYNLIDHRGDESFSFWDERVSEYKEKRINYALNQGQLYAAINLIEIPENIFNENLNTGGLVIYIHRGSNYLSDDTMKKLITKLSGTNKFLECEKNNEAYLLIRDFETGEIIEIIGDNDIKQVTGDDYFNSSIGGMNLISSNDYKNLYVNDDVENNLFDMEEHYNDDVQIIIYKSADEIYNLYYD